MFGRIVQLRGRPLLNQWHVSHFHSSHAVRGKVLRTFKLADIGEGITECEVIRWSVKPSATVQSFDALCEVQSDKASVEITSPFDGIMKDILVKEGEVAKVGEGLCVIEVEEEGRSEANESASASPPPHPEQEVVKSKHFFSGADGASQSSTLSSRKPHPLDPNAPAQSTRTADVLATPSVRHFAREKGVDLAHLAPGSGRNGRIEKQDVEAYLSTPKTSSISAPTSRQAAGPETDVVVDLGRTRYGMWKAMIKSLEIPHFGYSTKLDLTSLHDMLHILNSHIPAQYLSPSVSHPHPPAVSASAFYTQPTSPLVEPSGQFTRLTYLPILLKTLSKAMVEWPLFRSSITPSSAESSDKPTLTLRPHADISIALSTPTGLYTPTLQRVDTQSVYSLASQLKHLSHLGRQVPSALTPAEMPKRGGTLTVSNIGGIGDGESAHPVLVPGGGVAIVAIGRAKWMWDVSKSEGERRLKVDVSWTADHRVVEGAELVAFVEAWRGWVETPQRFIGEGI